MKNILILLLILLLFTSCGVKSNDSTQQESATSSLEQTTIFSSELIKTTNITSSPTESSLVDNVFAMDEPYSFSEVNPLLGIGSFSVNDLSEIFGEPSFVEGYYNDRNVEARYYVISVMFKDVMFDLVANNGENLNLTGIDAESPIRDARYEVPDSAMDVQMKPQSMSILSGDWILPRGIKLGDSTDSLYNVYAGNRGEERFAQGLFLVSYDYGESGSIIYHFDASSSVIGKLKQVTIIWHSTSVSNFSQQSERTPCP